MGLESFKTEGPRTYTKDDGEEIGSGDDTIHILKGVDIDRDIIPPRVVSHNLLLREKLVDIMGNDTTIVYVCDECNSVTTSLEAKLKIDKLNFRDEDWYDSFMEEVLDQAKELDDEESMDSFATSSSSTTKSESSSSKSSSTESEEQSSSGLDSFKT